MPGGRSDTLALLQREQGVAANIKASATRKEVLRGLRKLEHCCPATTGARGLALFGCAAGVALLEPELPIAARLYRCDRAFHVDALRPLFRPRTLKGVWTCGWAHVTGVRATVSTTAVGAAATRLDRPGGGNKRHRKGGQSAPRFQRIFDEADAAWSKQAGEWIAKQLQAAGVNRVVFGGPGLSADAPHARVCRKLGFAVRVEVSDGNSDGFGRRVRDELAPAWERELARDHAARVWGLLQTDPDRVRVGRRDVADALEAGLVAELWAEDLKGHDVEAVDAVTRMPPGSLARVGGIAARLHYAVPLPPE